MYSPACMHRTLLTRIAAVGKLNLIDLAGSERVEKSGALDDKKMFDEARNINMVCECDDCLFIFKSLTHTQHSPCRALVT